ncbi:chromatin organization modifier (chromo) domain protein [Metarhizium robertsii]|uniref:Chromatin organization modifier (Chromo) domain protein n=1 Tax=Metarhizium robertsii TaxID=568076 RepID=A0A014PGH9_9HYPO|nr:chromatin organization modifier (chromo) domain protein [Metarhizium robertsii]
MYGNSMAYQIQLCPIEGRCSSQSSGKQSATDYRPTSVFPQHITLRPTARPKTLTRSSNNTFVNMSASLKTTGMSGFHWPSSRHATLSTIQLACALFFANTGYHSRMSFGPPRVVPKPTPKDIAERCKEGNNFVTKMQEITDILRTNLLSAQASQEKFANANRSPAPAYRVGDMVLLSTRNINSARPIPKLDHKFIGPFQIERVLGSHTYQLKLPHKLSSIHNSFHTNLLRPSPNDPLPGQHNPPPPPIALDEKRERLWAIDMVLESKRTKGKGFQYHMLWGGFSREEATWEPLHNVVNAHIAIKEFEKRYRNKPRPTEREIRTARSQARRDVEETT